MGYYFIDKQYPCQHFCLPVIDHNAVDAENVGDLPDQRLVGGLNTVVPKDKVY